MRSSTRRSRKMGPPGLVEKRPLYVQLMKEGHSTGQHARFLGSTPTRAIVGCMAATGWRAWCSKAWTRGPVRRFLRQAGPAAICQRTNASSLPTGCWFGRVFNPSPGSRRSPPQSAGSWPGIVPIHVAIIRSAPRKWHRREGRDQAAKLAGDDELRDYVVECLSKRWSPQQVCRALKERFPGEKHRHLAHETVYRRFTTEHPPRSNGVCPVAAIG